MGLRDRYMSGHGVWVDDVRPGIKVYFDAGGRLHVDGCLDAGLRGSRRQDEGMAPVGA